MKIARRFTQESQDVFQSVQWTKRSCKIANLDGSTVFEMNDAQVPASWSQLATDIMVSKYFRKAGVPQRDEKGQVQHDENGQVITGPERSVRQVVGRLAGCWTHWGDKHGYFDTPQDARAFHDEIAFMMLNQMAAPNSPQWFNTGLAWAYGITGPAQGHWYTDPESGQTKLASDAYSHPQPHACFIQSINDDLVNDGGIMDLWVREARLFKYGSGTGTNFSKLRGEEEPLSGGGKSSGLMSWLRIGDRAAGAIKSGGTTRRAAKMVCLDLDHPDIESFINWKVREEIKVAAMVEGLKKLSPNHRETAERLGLKLDYDFNGESYQTVSGQNSNNSVRVSNAFFHALDQAQDWPLVNRTDGQVAKKIPAKELWEQIGFAAWRCADPGVQYDTTINEWHTCPASGRINASNPCSEYMFLDNTACNLASLNLLKFYDPQKRLFDIEGFEHATRLWTVVLEISVLMASFPSQEIAQLSYGFRTLGLGYANIGAMLMQAGIPYDSEQGRTICGAITAILTGRSYATSAQMAAEHSPFPNYEQNRDTMLRVIRNHRRAAHGVPKDPQQAANHALGDYEGLEVRPVPIDRGCLEEYNPNVGWLNNAVRIIDQARAAWDQALELGTKHGYRNAQATVIAPTGTIGLLMDCDTTGVEPDFALIKFKKLAGGGYFKIANQSLRPALVSLEYSQDQIKEIMRYVLGTLDLETPLPAADGTIPQSDTQPPQTFAGLLRSKGLIDEDLRKLTDALPTVFELQHAFTAWTLGESAMGRLGLTQADIDAAGGSLLRAVGLTDPQIQALNMTVCGTQTVEGAPHLKALHLPVFDCANPCGSLGKRFIATQGHIRMMAAAQPFISGAISKTINLPNTATVTDIQAAYRLSWELALKANALYRDGCKLSQPLSTKSDDADTIDDGVEDQEGIEMGKQEVADEVAAVAGQVASVTTQDTSQTSVEVHQEKIQHVEKIVERVVERPLRQRLPDTRRSVTHKFNVAGHEGYLTVGLYEDGSPGELFITMAKEGSTIGGLMDSLGTAVSVALQYGVPVESLVNKFTHQRFEPAGATHNPDVPFAKSLVDYIFRWMGMEFVSGYRAANAPMRPGQASGSGDRPRIEARSTPVIKTISPPTKYQRTKGSTPTPKPQSNTATDNQTHPTPPTQANSQQLVTLLRRTTTASDGSTTQATAVSTGAVHVQENQDGTKVVEERVSVGLTASMTQMQADAPACDICGTITVRSGTCYKCLNCGNSMGCS